MDTERDEKGRCKEGEELDTKSVFCRHLSPFPSFSFTKLCLFSDPPSENKINTKNYWK